MGITKDDVKHVGRLARLKLTEDEINLFTEQLGNILKYIEQLKEVNTDNIDSAAHSADLKNVWREDKQESFSDREKILENAPEREGDFFNVKKVIE